MYPTAPSLLPLSDIQKRLNHGQYHGPERNCCGHEYWAMYARSYTGNFGRCVRIPLELGSPTDAAMRVVISDWAVLGPNCCAETSWKERIAAPPSVGLDGGLSCVIHQAPLEDLVAATGKAKDDESVAIGGVDIISWVGCCLPTRGKALSLRPACLGAAHKGSEMVMDIRMVLKISPKLAASNAHINPPSLLARVIVSPTIGATMPTSHPHRSLRT
ncbi:hypothetical protein B0H13DRAFT_1873560 [Mycena leptocephala]|nr:hypothetical protein B0H13DRAFT_1873560 [Mycena leptocephala]